MIEISAAGWITAGLAALMFGISKTGLPGLGMLAIPLMADILGAKTSTGIVLPMLIFADIFAVAYYHRQAVWKHLLRLAPWAAAGVVLGYRLMGRIDDRQLKPLIGLIVLAMLAVHLWRSRRPDAPIPTHWLFSAVIGILAGVTTMLANAASSILAVYFLSLRLPKNEFVGTGAWYYMILNWFKVPFSVSLGLINPDSLRFNLMLFPLVGAGALAGILLLRVIPERPFNRIVQLLTAAAAVKLLF
ncbi:MAG TPA: sulfite exporter TauE/SafE family protein [bacterium]|uniref:Probable membrane transporter protein n=1 Tax=candidate division TA06 bacterium ADurb.Bin417 TaxID=1852828 RepID=A0A1V5MID9_UNCT6|nr:MAG: Sulfite exporter TauE/SafE [candidate division TA06 bacterium ADurb.Bin417]HNQ35447.1 sulfite exporter TauE/SafE family protein [bacterium]HNS48837.1 sulfite exporter TauE/SafE family protein [bacterium]